MGSNLISWDLSQNKGIVWRRPITTKDKGFIVKPYEYGLFFRNGEYQEIFEGGSHKLQKKEKVGSEIIYVIKTNLKIDWGIPQRNGVYTQDTVLGCNGNITVKINDPLNFYSNVVIAQSIQFTKGIEEEVFLEGEKKREKITKAKLEEKYIDVQTAIRDKMNPYLYTHDDLQAWILDTIRNILRDKLSQYPGHVVIRGGVEKDELISEIRAQSVEEFQEWGLDVITFNIRGWILEPEYERKMQNREFNR